MSHESRGGEPLVARQDRAQWRASRVEATDDPRPTRHARSTSPGGRACPRPPRFAVGRAPRGAPPAAGRRHARRGRQARGGRRHGGDRRRGRHEQDSRLPALRRPGRAPRRGLQPGRRAAAVETPRGDREQQLPAGDGGRGDRDLPGLPRGRPRALPVRRAPAERRPADRGRPGQQPLRPRRRAGRGRRVRRPAGGRPRSGGRRAVGPRRRRPGPFGRRLVAARRAPHAPQRTRCSSDRSGLGRPLRRREHPSGGQVTSSLPGTVDPQKIQEVLDGRWAHVRRDARENLRDEEFLPVYGETMQEARERVTRMSKRLADSGRVGLGFPKEYGGESDSGGSVTSIEMLAFGDLSLMVKAGVQWGLFGGALQLLGTKRQHDKYLRDVMSFDLPGCFAMTETGHGSDVQQLRTTCTYDPATQTFDLHTPHQAARKDYIGNAAKDGRMAVVFAQLITQGKNRGVHAWLVPIRDENGNPMPGVTIGDDGPKAGLLGVDNGRLTFDHVTVPRDMLLDRYGQVAEDGTYTSSIENETRRFFTMLGTLVRGRVSVGGSAASATKLALDIAVRYGDVRRQFAAPGDDREIVINDYLVHQRKLLPALATSYGLHFAQGELVELMHDVQGAADLDEGAQRELESRAAGLKVAQTWHATRTIQMCREACGGAGYLQENRLPHLKADTDVFTTFEGDNTVLLQLVAKGLLTGYRDTFGSLDGWGRVGFIADMVRETVLERTAARALIARLVDAVPGRDDEVPMLDRGWQLKMFEFREKHSLEGAIRRLRKNSTTEGMAPFDMFNDVQDHVLKTAQTHIDRIVLEALVAGIERTPDPAAKALLGRVCDLYALSTIEADKGWFLEHGRLTPTRAKALTGAVNDLLKQLRPHMRTLVDAFAIPDAWLNCAIVAEEPGRQETMAEHDAALRAAGAQPQADATATDLEMAPAQ